MEPTKTYTRFDIYTSEGTGKVKVRYESNDDNDDGYPDDDVVTGEYEYPSLESALKFVGHRSHTGSYGQPVSVYVDGERR